MQVSVLGDHRGLPVRGSAVRAVVAHIYSKGAFLPIKECNQQCIDAQPKAKKLRTKQTTSTSTPPPEADALLIEGSIVEMRAHAKLVMKQGGALKEASWRVDDEGVLEAYALADLWCLADLKADYERYLNDTWSVQNAIDRCEGV